MSKARLLPVLVLAWMAVGAGPIAAHPLPLEVQVYLTTPENGSMLAIVRMPSAFLADARLPRREDGYLDLARIEEPMAGVAAYVVRTLDLMIDGRPLAGTLSTWSITRADNRIHDDLDSVSAEAGAPRPPSSANVNPDTMVVILAFKYALPDGIDPAGHLSVRVNDFRVSNQDVQMRVRPVSRDDLWRAIVTKGTPRRIDLNPSAVDVLALFSRRGLERLRLSIDLLLFLLVLAISRRPLGEAIGAFAAFAGGCVIGLAALAAAGDGTALFVPVFGASSAAMLVVAALQNFTGARLVWTRATAVAFGFFEGAIFGSLFGSEATLAGSHGAVAFAAYAAPILAGALLFFLMARPMVELACRTRLQERWAVLLLSAVPIHTGLHGMMGIFKS